MGDGGGFGSSRGEASSSLSCEGEVGADIGESGAVLERADLPLFPDLTEAVSDFSPTSVSPLLKPEVELRGLSVLVVILDFNPRKERTDSLVSDLLNDG